MNPVLGRNEAVKLMLAKAARIECRIAQAETKKELRALNKSWWRLFFALRGRA